MEKKKSKSSHSARFAPIELCVFTWPGYTLLHCAAAWGRLETLKALVELDADIEAQNYWQETPRDVADRYSQTECMEFLDWAGKAARKILERRWMWGIFLLRPIGCVYVLLLPLYSGSIYYSILNVYTGFSPSSGFHLWDFWEQRELTVVASALYCQQVLGGGSWGKKVPPQMGCMSNAEPQCCCWPSSQIRCSLKCQTVVFFMLIYFICMR